MLNQELTQQVELQSAAKRVRDARIDLLSSDPFYGLLAMRLEMMPVPGYEHLAGVDGKHMFYNPAGICELDHETAVGLLEHEILHLALGHHTRRSGRPAMKWNMACDYAVNSILISSGKRLPESALHGPQFEGMTAEEIYAALEDEEKSPEEDFGTVLDEDQAPEASGQEWEVNVTQAMKAAEKAGSLPGGLKDSLQEILHPVTPWRHVLRSLLTSLSRDDYNWARPNKRFLSSGLYLPEARSEAAGTLVLVVDTSGSINKPLLDSFLSELNLIFEEVSYDEIRVLFIGMTVREEKVFYSNEPLDAGEYTSGGGTRFRPAFKRVQEAGIVPDALIYFTDLHIRELPEDPGYPVIWAAPAGVHTNRFAWNPSFGEVLELR